MTGIYQEIWDDLPKLSRQTIELRYAYAESFWSRHGIQGLDAFLNAAAFLMNQAAASSPAGSFLPGSPAATATKLDDSAHQADLASLTWVHIAGHITAGQMKVEDPSLGTEASGFARYGADALFWFLHWSGWALSDMSKRLSDEEFDRRVQFVIDELQDD